MRILPHHRFICCIPVLSLFLAACAGPATQENINKTSAAKNGQTLAQQVSEITLREFYKFPVGPRGLEPTEKLLGLNNKRVRITGYMVKEEEPSTGLFMLAPLPVSLAEKEDGPADDLPAATLFVHMPLADADKAMAFRPGVWELTGTLKIGNKEEANGRVSYTQLILD
ncbi:MAG: hypothetical protein Q8N96_08530 [Methylovulum sp.]|nr:hypothetical protein [Methylovulum sp.]